MKGHEDEVFPDLQAQWNHAHAAAIEKFHSLHIGSADQPPIQRVSPSVILAAQDIFAAAAQSDRPRAVPANIAECTQHALFVPYHDDRFTGDVCREITFGIGNGPLYLLSFRAALTGDDDFPAGLIERADELPSPPKDLFPLNLENVRIGIEARSQRLRAFNLFIHIQMQGFRRHRSESLTKNR
jgi:hypothetical protein